MVEKTGTADIAGERHWPREGLTRVPYWVFQDEEIYAREQREVFRGETWNYLCLEMEVPEAGDFRTSFIGDASVIVVRDDDGTIHGFENRCAHRGALIALEDRGNARQFSCVYHAWTYDRQGNLVSVAFKNGVKGRGGMPSSFHMEEHGPRKLRIARVCGIVFGSFSATVPPIETYLGEEIVARIGRVLRGRTPMILGRFTQALPNNWKLYMENVKDSYHASILHLFFTTFQLNRLSQKGAIIVDSSGGHHVSYSAIDRAAEKDNAEYSQQNIRSHNDAYRLADPSLLDGFEEFGDDITLQILTVFPGFVLQQIRNAIAIRQILPRGTGRTDLVWTYLGFVEDTPEQRNIRLKQANLMGPAGYISMEDGCVGGFVQRGIVAAPDHRAVLQMGGDGAGSDESRVTEASVRGFWKAYRARMGL